MTDRPEEASDASAAKEEAAQRVVHLIKDPTVRRLRRNGTRKRKPKLRQEAQPKTA